MKLKLNKTDIVDNFLNPVSKVTDKCIINLSEDLIYTLTNNSDETIILYSVYKSTNPLPNKEVHKLNVPDVKRLCRVFDCINEDVVEFDINSNNIEYTSDDVKFTYHLLEDGIIQNGLVSTDKIKSLAFDCSFNLKETKLAELLKGSSFASGSNKIYFSTRDKKVFAELTDKNIQNVDSISYLVSDSYTGADLVDILPMNLEIIRTFSGLKFKDIVVKINTKLKVLMFEINNSNCTMKYIVSALVK